MTQLQQDGADLEQKLDVSRGKRPISERKLRANRANAQRSTGPRTEAGKAVARWNALKHGIRSCSPDLPLTTTGPDLRSVKLRGSPVADALGTESALHEINRICDKLARVVAFEHDCARRPDGLDQNGLLIYRYERTLVRKLHARVRECADLGGGNKLRRTL